MGVRGGVREEQRGEVYMWQKGRGGKEGVCRRKGGEGKEGGCA